jgi:5-methylthioadenosine/S-adenosylhomocysteine deaminase
MKNIFNFPLVNCHTHAAMVAFRGLAEDVPLREWLEKYIFPMEKEKVNPTFVYEQTKIAIKEMQKNGIKVFCDMYFFEDQVARAAQELKMRVVIGEGILDSPTPSAENPDEALKITENLLNKYKNNTYVSVAVSPHSIYTVSKENLIKAKNLAKKYNAIYHIHLAETKMEFDECLKNNNLTPTAYLDKLGVLDEKTVLAHCVWLNDEDIDIIAKRKSKVAHCPLSNLKLGSGIAPISKMIEKGITVALGTDGAASSNRLDIWEAGKFAALLQKGINHDPTKISAKKAIEIMTINGLKALGINSLEGKSISEIEKEILNIKDFNFLYELNIEGISLPLALFRVKN